MEVEAIAEGVWRWTATHPEWKAGEGWEPEVGCVYYENAGAVVLFDPLVPAGEEERFFRALDRDVERARLPVHVMLTSAWHVRSAAELEARYNASREPAAGVEAIRVSVEEVVYWLPGRRTLVAGDALLGTAADLRLQPPSWVEGDYGAFVAAVAALCELPVERLLPSHGGPVVAGAAEALERAVAQAQSSSATET